MSVESEEVGLPDNAVIEEVRRARQKLWQQAGESIPGLLRLVNERREALGRGADPAQARRISKTRKRRRTPARGKVRR